LTANRASGDSFIVLAEAHGVVPHFSRALSAIEPDPSQLSSRFFAALQERYRAHLFSTLTLTAELFRVLELLSQSPISCAIVKGPILALRAYGDPAARQYGDIDLLLHHSDVRRASEFLVAGGYESRIPAGAIKAGKTPGQYLFRRPGTSAVVELHTERTLRYFPRPLQIEEFSERRTSLPLDGRLIPALSAEDEFVLISIHGAKHFWERLMWISDVAAMVYNNPELDWERVRQSAADVGAERMVRLALLLAERLLRVPVPPEMKSEVVRDSTCLPIVRKIESWLPYAGYHSPRVAQRALFRLRMGGGLLAGASYLARLWFSTTEDDWSAGEEISRSRLSEILRRSVRLAKKYRRNSES
jgi:Uncharacterised nucleotidyltransferase